MLGKTAQHAYVMQCVWPASVAVCLAPCASLQKGGQYCVCLLFERQHRAARLTSVGNQADGVLTAGLRKVSPQQLAVQLSNQLRFSNCRATQQSTCTCRSCLPPVPVPRSQEHHGQVQVKSCVWRLNDAESRDSSASVLDLGMGGCGSKPHTGEPAKQPPTKQTATQPNEQSLPEPVLPQKVDVQFRNNLDTDASSGATKQKPSQPPSPGQVDTIPAHLSQQKDQAVPDKVWCPSSQRMLN